MVLWSFTTYLSSAISWAHGTNSVVVGIWWDKKLVVYWWSNNQCACYILWSCSSVWKHDAGAVIHSCKIKSSKTNSSKGNEYTALNPGFPFWILCRSFWVNIQSCETKSGTESLGSRLINIHHDMCQWSCTFCSVHSAFEEEIGGRGKNWKGGDEKRIGSGNKRRRGRKKSKEKKEDGRWRGWGGGCWGSQGRKKWGSDKMEKEEGRRQVRKGRREKEIDLPHTYHGSIEDYHSASQWQQTGPLLALQWDNQCQRDTRNPVEKNKLHS